MNKVIKSVPGYDESYWVSPDGDVFRKMNCSSTHKQGYVRVALKKPGPQPRISNHIMVHRLVAQAYIDNPTDAPHVNHKSNQKDDNRVENLEWCTPSQNNLHREKFRTRPGGRKKNVSKNR